MDEKLEKIKARVSQGDVSLDDVRYLLEIIDTKDRQLKRKSQEILSLIDNRILREEGR